MEERWRRYETLMIFDPELGMEGIDELVQRSRDFVTQETGRILKSERWGLRDLAFELKGRRKGYYLLLTYAGTPRVATELDRRLNLIDTVLKYQTVKLEERVDPASLPEGEEVIEEQQPTPAEAAPAAAPAAAAQASAEEAEDAAEEEDEAAGEGEETEDDAEEREEG